MKKIDIAQAYQEKCFKKITFCILIIRAKFIILHQIHTATQYRHLA